MKHLINIPSTCLCKISKGFPGTILVAEVSQNKRTKPSYENWYPLSTNVSVRQFNLDAELQSEFYTQTYGHTFKEKLLRQLSTWWSH